MTGRNAPAFPRPEDESPNKSERLRTEEEREVKKLEELKISPTPWRICDERCLDGSVIGVESSDAKSDLVAGDAVITEANARLVAAAPKLYEAGYEVVIDKCKRCVWCNRDPGNRCEYAGKCKVKNLRAALDEAGESEAE